VSSTQRHLDPGWVQVPGLMYRKWQNEIAMADREDIVAVRCTIFKAKHVCWSCKPILPILIRVDKPDTGGSAWLAACRTGLKMSGIAAQPQNLALFDRRFRCGESAKARRMAATSLDGALKCAKMGAQPMPIMMRKGSWPRWAAVPCNLMRVDAMMIGLRRQPPLL